MPFLNYQKGIYRAAAQRGPAALSIQTSANSPYDDEEADDGFMYAYRAGLGRSAGQSALRAAFALQVPVVYFVGTRPGFYRALYPWYVEGDMPDQQRVWVSAGKRVGPLDELEPIPIDDPIEKRYAVRTVRVRLHQGPLSLACSSRLRPPLCDLPASRGQPPRRAHIIEDRDPRGEPEISNGVSLCSIHHRAFDTDLVGVSPDYEVHVSRRLLDEKMARCSTYSRPRRA